MCTEKTRHRADFKMGYTFLCLPFSSWSSHFFAFSTWTWMKTHTHMHNNMHNCCPFSAILAFFTLERLLFCIFSRGKQLSLLPKMLPHIIGLLTGCIVAVKKKSKKKKRKGKSFIRGEEPSSANGLHPKSDVPVITADLTSSSYHNSFRLSAAGVLTRGVETPFSRVSGAQEWKPFLRR